MTLWAFGLRVYASAALSARLAVVRRDVDDVRHRVEILEDHQD